MTTSRTMGTMRGPLPPPRDKAHLHLTRAHDEGLPPLVHPHGDVQDLPHSEGQGTADEAPPTPLTWVWVQLFTWSRYSVALWSLALIAVAVAVGRR